VRNSEDRRKSEIPQGRREQIGGGHPILEVVDGGRGVREDGVEEADGLGPVPSAAEACELREVGAHGG
jgi:hypothetical protein